MMSLWRRIVSKFHGPSVQTVEARERLSAVQRDDARVNRVVDKHREIARENHLGPLIAELFERRQR